MCNGCNDVSLGNHCVPEGHRIPSLKSHGKELEEESAFSLVSSVMVVMRLPIFCASSSSSSSSYYYYSGGTSSNMKPLKPLGPMSLKICGDFPVLAL